MNPVTFVGNDNCTACLGCVACTACAPASSIVAYLVLGTGSVAIGR